MLTEILVHNLRSPELVRTWAVLSAAASSPDHPAHAYFTRRYETTRAAFLKSFGTLGRQGRLRPGVSPERAAIVLIALWDGLQVQWLLDREVVDIADALHECIDALADVDWDESDATPAADGREAAE
jgi:hypothetical protein